MDKPTAYRSNEKPLTVNDILPYMGKTKKRGNETIGTCPICGKAGHLYATDKGGKLLVYCQKCNAKGEELIKAFIGKGAKGEPIDQTPVIVEKIIYDYHNPDGSLAYQKLRRKYDNGSKEFVYMYREEGQPIVYRKPDNSVNLYNLDLLAKADPTTTLYIVEGEKCAKAMVEHGFLATTGHCGSQKQLKLTDADAQTIGRFTCQIVIPDNDAKGEDYTQIWRNAHILKMQEFWEDCPQKGDVADYFAQGGTADAIRQFEGRYRFTLTPQTIADINDWQDLTADGLLEALWEMRCDSVGRERIIGMIHNKARELKASVKRWDAVWKAYQNKKASLLTISYGNKSKIKMQSIEINTGDWQATDKGIIELTIDTNGIAKPKIICHTPMLPIERLYNIEERTEKARIEYYVNQRRETIIVPRTTLANMSKIITLADVGIGIDSNNAKPLTKYFTDTLSKNDGIIPVLNSISHLGYCPLGFVPYVDNIVLDTGRDMETLVNSIGQEGILEEWVDAVKPLRDNIIVRMVVAAAFASPLVSICGCLPFIVHTFGMTGSGKTVALMVAASVWGNPDAGRLVRSMNMTLNNLTTIAATLYNIPFFGDELQTIKSRDGNYDRLIMGYTEGIERGRNKNGQEIDKLRTWRNVFVSTGEEPITVDRSAGGAKNRVIEVECEGQIIENGNATADFVREHYGTAGREYIDRLPDRKTIRAEYRAYFDDALRRGETTEKQAMAVALLALGDKYSSELIFGDGQADPETFYKFCKKKNEVDTAEMAWEFTQNWIAQNYIKFVGKIEHDYTGEIWGKVENGEIWVNKMVLCKALQNEGYVFNAIKKAWAKKGWLVLNNQGRLVQLTTIDGIRFTCIRLKNVKENVKSI